MIKIFVRLTMDFLSIVALTIITFLFLPIFIIVNIVNKNDNPYEIEEGIYYLALIGGESLWLIILIITLKVIANTLM